MINVRADYIVLSIYYQEKFEKYKFLRISQTTLDYNWWQIMRVRYDHTFENLVSWILSLYCMHKTKIKIDHSFSGLVGLGYHDKEIKEQLEDKMWFSKCFFFNLYFYFFHYGVKAVVQYNPAEQANCCS